MLKTTFVNRLATDFPDLRFKADNIFAWSPDTKTIHFNSNDDNFEQLILHEIGHFLSGHSEYVFDIELIKMEREAWTAAQHKLAKKYNIVIDKDFVESNLDTYRDWLFARSKCPNCSLTGIQVADLSYKCVACNQKWRTNDARHSRLKRSFIN